MDGTIRITDACPVLLPQLLELEELCFSVPWTQAMLRHQMEPENHVFLAALSGETLAGYVGLSYVLDEGYISNVAVHPDFRRQGIARALLTELERRARELGLAFLTLEVRAGNAPAIALYAGCGYREVGRRKGYYEKPAEDAVLMTKYFEVEEK